jgi:DNA polymerase-3 subunit gamma/tau
LSLADQAIAFGAGALAETGVREMLGAVDRGHAVRIVEALAASDGAALVAAADALRGLGLSAAGTLEELSDLLQQMAVRQAVPDALDASDPETPTVARLAGLLPADETQLIYSMALHGRAELGLAPDEYSGLVMVLLRMLAFRPPSSGDAEVVPQRGARPAPAPAPAVVLASPTPPRPIAITAVKPQPAAPSTMASRPVAGAKPAREEPPPWVDAPFDDEVAERGTAQVPVQLASPDRPAASAPAVASVVPPVRTAFGDRWADVVEQMVQQGSITALVRELAMQSQCLDVAVDGPTAVWRLRAERETLRAATQRDKLQAALSQWLKQPVKLEVEAGVAEDSPALRAAAERERRQREAEQIIHNDPLVQALMSQYKTARIVPGSVKPH